MRRKSDELTNLQVIYYALVKVLEKLGESQTFENLVLISIILSIFVSGIGFAVGLLTL